MGDVVWYAILTSPTWCCSSVICILHLPFLALDCLSLYLGFPTDHVTEGEGEGDSETGAK